MTRRKEALREAASTNGAKAGNAGGSDLEKTNWLMSLNHKQKEALRIYAREQGQTMSGVVQGWIKDNCMKEGH